MHCVLGGGQTRVCGNCGQRGHMKTSKKLCPRWHEFNAPKSTEPSNALPSNFGGGLALPSLLPQPKPVPKPALKFKLGGAGGAGSPPAMGSPLAQTPATPADYNAMEWQASGL